MQILNQEIKDLSTSLQSINELQLLKDHHDDDLHLHHHHHHHNNNNEEIQYSKGYVNVLKERFSRKYFHNNNNNNNADIDTQPLQPQQQQPSVQLRNRSTSPNLNKNLKLRFKSNENLPHNHLSASLTTAQQQQHRISLPLSASLTNTTINTNTGTDIVKCTYINEINADELPKANFVSSVKNLFENKSKENQQSKLNLYQKSPSSSSTCSSSLQSTPSTPPSVKSSLQKSNSLNNRPTKNAILILNNKTDIENLVERIKQNGTVVYDHQIDSKSSNTNDLIQPATPIATPDRPLTFKERKELFSRQQPASVTVKQDEKIHNKRQKIEEEVVQQQPVNPQQHDHVENNKDDELDNKDSNDSTHQQQTTKKVSSVKTKTFFAGKEVENGGLTKLTTTTTTTKCTVEFLNAGVKLDKSSITYTQTTKSSTKVNVKVNFKDCHETYEYPSYESVLKELGIDPNTDHNEDDANEEQHIPKSITNDNDELEENLLLFAEKLNKNFNNFKPSWMFDYELGGSLYLTNNDDEAVNTNGEAKTENQQNEPEKQWSLEMDSNILF